MINISCSEETNIQYNIHLSIKQAAARLDAIWYTPWPNVAFEPFCWNVRNSHPEQHGTPVVLSGVCVPTTLILR